LKVSKGKTKEGSTKKTRREFMRGSGGTVVQGQSYGRRFGGLTRQKLKIEKDTLRHVSSIHIKTSTFPVSRHICG